MSVLNVLIKRLEVTGIRNLQQVSLHDLATINLFSGANGAGKTSVLEAIHLLSSAKSFRSHKLKPVINNNSDACVVFGEVDIPSAGFQPIGIKRYKSSSTPGLIRVAGKVVKSASFLAESLPLQVVSSDTFKLLEGAPLIRRQFLDWGVFHVEHDFHKLWKSTQRCLKQRNTLLRHARMDSLQLAVWTEKLARLGEDLHLLRERYFQHLVPIFEQILAQLTELEGLQLSYFKGWEKTSSLAEVLATHEERELEQGHTLYGPHRADLKLRYQGSNAAEILSRGQQKLVVCALRVAQGYLLSQLTGKRCVYLIDDLPAELDKAHRLALCRLLEELKCQVFITCVDPQDVVGCWSEQTDVKMFHVEQGSITANNS